MSKAFDSGRPTLVYNLSEEQERAIVDYFFLQEKVKTLRELAPILRSSIQGASNIASRTLAQWAREGRVVPKL